MSVQTQIDRITNEVTTQEELLDLALSILQSKAAGEGGGGYNMDGYTFVKVASDFECIRSTSTIDITSFEWWKYVTLENIHCVTKNILCTTTGTFSSGATCTPIVSYSNGIITLNRTSFSGNLAVSLIMDVYVAIPLSVMYGNLVNFEGVNLPDGYAMEMGIYNTADHVYTTSVSVPLKNSYIWNQSGRTTNTYLFLCGLNYPTGSQGVLGGICTRMNSVTARRSNIVSSGSSTTTTSTNVIDLADGDTTNELTLRGTSSYPLRKDVDYLWVVIGETVKEDV